MNIGRNDPCSCGSGKKYKKCCSAKDDEARAAAARLAGEVKAPAEGARAAAHRASAGATQQRPKAQQANKPAPLRRRAV